MRYPILIEQGSAHAAYGVIVPDLSGCFSAGDTLDEAMTNVEEAAAAWIDATLDAGGAIPEPSAIEDIRARSEYADWALGVVTIDPATFDDATTRINVSLPVRVLSRLDAKVRESGEKDRSSFIAKMAMG